MLARRPRRSQVKALSYSTLVCLEGRRFLALMESNPRLRANVEARRKLRETPGAAIMATERREAVGLSP